MHGRSSAIEVGGSSTRHDDVELNELQRARVSHVTVIVDVA